MVEAFTDAFKNLEHAVKLSHEGVGVEFGVYSGKTLSIIRKHHTGPVFGFDSFEGLPETWRKGFTKGHFFTKQIPTIEGTTIVVGLFNATVPSSLEALKEPITFVHFDADLYSSTIFALEKITPYLSTTCIFVFDEYENYPGYKKHEYKAFQEWQDNHPEFSVLLISTVPSHEQATFKITKKEM